MSYHELFYCPTEKEMREFIEKEFKGTSGEEVTIRHFWDLLKEHSYQTEHHMGCNTTEVFYQMFHENLTEFYKILDSATLYGEDEKPVQLSISEEC